MDLASDKCDNAANVTTELGRFNRVVVYLFTVNRVESARTRDS